MCGMIFTARGIKPWRVTSCSGGGGRRTANHHHHHHPAPHSRAGTVWEDPPCTENNNLDPVGPDTGPNKEGGKGCRFNARLSRSLSTPRRCHYCQKIMFFKTYRCKHCRYRCHKKCAGHNHSKSRSCHRSLSGEEHWTKVLQANEVNSNLVVVPCHLPRTAHPAHVPTDTSSVGGGGVGAGGGKSRHASTITTTTMTTDASSPKCAKSHSSSSTYYHAPSARTNAKDAVDGPECGGACTPGSSPGSPSVAAALAAAVASSKDGRTSPNIFSTLYDRLCRWMQTAGVRSRRSGGSGSRSRTPRSPRSLSRSSSVASTKSQDFYQLLHNMPEDFTHGHHDPTCIHASMSSEDSELGSFRQASYSSTCSSLTITSASTTCSGDWPNQSNVTDSFPPSNISTGYFNPAASTPTRKSKTRAQFFSVGSKGIPHTNLTFTISCPLKTKRQSISGTATDQRDRSSLCATWPPTGRKTYANDEEEEEVPENKEEHADVELDDAVFGDPDEPKSWEQREAELRESLREFSIPWKDVDSGECLRIGRTTQICRGKWHGDVMVHTFPDVKETEVTRFWEEVAKLSMIRHENVALFMGACIEPPNLAVITSVRRGASLYEQVHIIKDKMSLHTRVHIVRQIAQGMGYLHAKGVVMSKLNSKNIYMEPKVKLCLVDYSMAEKKYERPGYGYVPKGHLTYVAPEVLRTLVVVEPRLVPNTPYTTESDVFAFGTVMFELMTGQFPFRRMPSEVLIWQVGRGFRQSLKHLKYSASLKSVISQCWAHEPADRPTLTDINKHFQFNGALHKRHSSSEPERLNTSGITAKKTIL